MADIINVVCPVCHHAQSLPRGGLSAKVKKYNVALDPSKEVLIQVRESIGGGGRGVKTKGTGFVTKQTLTFDQAMHDPRFSRLAGSIMDKIGRVFGYLDGAE